MSDIVKRLRAPANWLRQDKGSEWRDVINHYDRTPFDAADEITRLREALREIDEIGRVAAQVPGPRNKLMEICARARAAMGGGDE